MGVVLTSLLLLLSLRLSRRTGFLRMRLNHHRCAVTLDETIVYLKLAFRLLNGIDEVDCNSSVCVVAGVSRKQAVIRLAGAENEVLDVCSRFVIRGIVGQWALSLLDYNK